MAFMKHIVRLFAVVACVLSVVVPPVSGQESPDSALFCDGEEVTVDLAKGEKPSGGPDVILGTPGDDVIRAKGGSDVICAGAGNDTIRGGPGNDRIFGGDGNDTIFDGPGDDVVWAGEGDDRVRDGLGSDSLYGEGGDDYMRGNANCAPNSDPTEWQNHLYGGEGDDVLISPYGMTGDEGDDKLTLIPVGCTPTELPWLQIADGGEGHDTLRVSPKVHKLPKEERKFYHLDLWGGDGDDDMRGWAHMLGGDGDDLLVGSPLQDDLGGFEGNDKIVGRGGDDFISGGRGADVIRSGPGADTVHGGGGNDTCTTDKDDLVESC